MQNNNGRSFLFSFARLLKESMLWSMAVISYSLLLVITPILLIYFYCYKKYYGKLWKDEETEERDLIKSKYKDYLKWIKKQLRK